MLTLIAFAITTVIVIALIVVSILAIKSGVKDMQTAAVRKRESAKSDFEHRTSGGVLQYATFEDAEQASRNRQVAVGTGNLGAFKMFGAVLLIVVVIPLIVLLVVSLAMIGFFSTVERMFG